MWEIQHCYVWPGFCSPLEQVVVMSPLTLVLCVCKRSTAWMKLTSLSAGDVTMCTKLCTHRLLCACKGEPGKTLPGQPTHSWRPWEHSLSRRSLLQVNLLCCALKFLVCGFLPSRHISCVHRVGCHLHTSAHSRTWVINFSLPHCMSRACFCATFCFVSLCNCGLIQEAV